MKTTATALILILMLSLASVSLGMMEEVRMSGGDGDRRVTLDLQGTPVRAAVEQLLKGRPPGMPYAIESDIQGTVTLHMQDVPWPDALQAVLRTAGLTMRLSDGVYIIGPARQPPPPRPGGRAPEGALEISPSGSVSGVGPTFDVKLENANVYDAIKQLLTVAKENYVYDVSAMPPGDSSLAPRVNAVIRGMPLSSLLMSLTKAVGLSVDATMGAYVIYRPAPSHLGATIAGPGAPMPVPSPGMTVTAPTGAPAQFTCPRCSGPLSADWSFCPKCGAQVQAGNQAQPPNKIIRPRPAPPAGKD